MDDLIRRSDAIKAMRNTLVAAEIPYAVNALFKISTVEPKRGEWIWYEQILGLVCSECKELGIERSNFCPNCGADMRGADDE